MATLYSKKSNKPFKFTKEEAESLLSMKNNGGFYQKKKSTSNDQGGTDKASRKEVIKDENSK